MCNLTFVLQKHYGTSTVSSKLWHPYFSKSIIGYMFQNKARYGTSISDMAITYKNAFRLTCWNPSVE
jgi:hypothetical protein